MPFPEAASKIPSAIGTLWVTLADFPGGATDEVEYRVEVLDQSGNLMEVKDGNLVPHLTAGQITALQDFMADMRTKAADEILP